MTDPTDQRNDQNSSTEVKTAADLVGEQILRELEWEYATVRSFEERGARVAAISTSVVGITLAAVSLNPSEESVSVAGRWLIGATLALFLIAAIAGVMVSRPIDYQRPSSDGLAAYLRPPHSSQPASYASRRLWESVFESLVSARDGHQERGRELHRAMWVMTAAIAMAIVTVSVVLAQGVDPDLRRPEGGEAQTEFDASAPVQRSE